MAHSRQTLSVNLFAQNRCWLKIYLEAICTFTIIVSLCHYMTAWIIPFLIISIIYDHWLSVTPVVMSQHTKYYHSVRFYYCISFMVSFIVRSDQSSEHSSRSVAWTDLKYTPLKFIWCIHIFPYSKNFVSYFF